MNDMTRYQPNALSQRDRISRATIALLRTDPFFASILLCQNIVERDVNGITVDGQTIAFNSEKLAALSDAQVQTMLAKSALRIATAQPFRFGGYADLELLADKPIPEGKVIELLNDAGGLSINSLLRGREMPKGWQMPEDRGFEDNKPMEFYYDAIRQAYEPPPEEPQGENNQNGPTGGEGGGGDTSSPPPDGENGPQGQPDGENGQSEADSQGDGTGSQNPDPNGPTDSRAVPHPDAGDPNKKYRAEQEWVSMIASAAMQAEQAGKMPSYLNQLVDHLLSPAQISWQEKLKRFAQKTIPHGSRTYSRPNRRHSWRAKDIASSTPHGRTVKKGVWITDTSGSMSADICNFGLNEIAEVMKRYPDIELVHIQCDAAVADIKTLKPKRDRVAVDKLMRSPEWKGRGGTDMYPAFAEAVKMKPQFIVCLTDGFGSFVDKAKAEGIPVFWLMTTDQQPPFGLTAKIEQKARRQ